MRDKSHYLTSLFSLKMENAAGSVLAHIQAHRKQKQQDLKAMKMSKLCGETLREHSWV